jgi:hypothetical protein
MSARAQYGRCCGGAACEQGKLFHKVAAVHAAMGEMIEQVYDTLVHDQLRGRDSELILPQVMTIMWRLRVYMARCKEQYGQHQPRIRIHRNTSFPP